MSLIGAIAVLLLADIGEGGPTPADRAKTERIRIEEKLSSQVPLDARFKSTDGRVVTLGELMRKDKPTLLSIGYYSCPMLCDVVLNSVKTGVKGVALEPGKDFQVISISVEPNDTVELAAEKKKNYLASLGREIDPSAWELLVPAPSVPPSEASPARVAVPGGGSHPGDGAAAVGPRKAVEREPDAEAKRVADAVGWNFFWDEDSKQWAHAAGVFVLTPEGKVSRVLYGIDYNGPDLKLALIEAGQGRVGTAVEKLLLWCFHYDPKGRTYVIYAIRVMRIGAALTVFGIIAMVALLARSNRRRQGAHS